MSEFGRADTPLRIAAALACQYETVAITTGLVPTITALARRCPLVGAVVLGALALHFRPLAEAVSEAVSE